MGPTENITRAFQRIWGPAVRSGGTKLENLGEVKQATGMMGGKPWGIVKIKTSDKCQDAAGTLNYFIPDAGQLKRMQIPWSAIFCAGEPVSAEVSFADPEAADVKLEKVLWAGESREAAFNFTTPTVWK